MGIGMTPACCGISGFDIYDGLEHVPYIVRGQHKNNKKLLKTKYTPTEGEPYYLLLV